MIIFSRKNPHLFKESFLSRALASTDVTVVSNPGQFKDAMAFDDREPIIIDRNDFPGLAQFVDILSKTAGRNAGVIVTDLPTEKQWRSENAAVKKSERRNRIILRRGKSFEKALDGDKLDIVIDTAATLSHEINNPLMAITGQVEMLLKNQNRLDEDVFMKIKLIGQAARRIRHVTGKLTRLDSLRFRETASGRMINFEKSDEPPD
jgi:signal transduction histidine kinase